MRRAISRTLWATLPALTLLLIGAPAAHAALSFGPIVPTACNCPGTAAGFGCVVSLINEVVQVAIAIGVMAASLAIAYTGFVFVTSATNSEGRTKARNMLINIAVGLVIVLASYLIVDFIMSKLYNGSFGAWSGILNDGSAQCITVTKPTAIANPVGGILGGTLGGTNPGQGGGGAGECPGNLICNSSNQCAEDQELDNGTGAAGQPCLQASSNCQSGLICDATDVCATAPGATNPGSCTQTSTGGGGTGANCPVPDQSTMTALPSGDVVGGTGLATAATVQNYTAMRAAALQAGFTLNVTSAYRSDASQVALWNQYCSSGSCGATKVAKPCSLGGTGSNHNSGQALDLTDGCSNGSSCNSAAYNWLKANGGQWNFRNSLPTDPVHWSPSGN